MPGEVWRAARNPAIGRPARASADERPAGGRDIETRTPVPGAAITVRCATPADLQPVLGLEQRAFGGDRLSRRSLRRLLAHGRNIVLVAVASGKIVGYALVLLRRGSGVARLYSMARDPAAAATFRGVGRRLLAAAEEAARAAGAAEMRLEVRPDNAAARRLYQASGYVVFARTADYYEDHADALRMRKSLEGTAL